MRSGQPAKARRDVIAGRRDASWHPTQRDKVSIVALLDRVLSEPSYGYAKDGALVVPSTKQLLREFGVRLNVLRSRKNWLPFFCWSATLLLTIPLALFARYHFSWPLIALGFVYSMIVLGSHGTIWFHRFATHRAYRFRNGFFRTLCRNLVIKIVPEEIYVISHHVHHLRSDQPGDPYNAQAGFLYCFLADANHQMINPELSSTDYTRLCGMLQHTGVRLNSFAQYQRWGSLCHPLWTSLHYSLNWAFWYGAFYLIGGHALALAMFGSAAVWAFGIRTFNFAGHGSGHDQRQEGVDFSAEDRSVNQVWPGYVAGEWHSNHHLYPGSARAGFLPYQLDLAFLFIRTWARLGAISSYRDSREDFLRDHYQPYRRASETPAQPVLIVEADRSRSLATVCADDLGV